MANLLLPGNISEVSYQCELVLADLVLYYLVSLMRDLLLCFLQMFLDSVVVLKATQTVVTLCSASKISQCVSEFRIVVKLFQYSCLTLVNVS
jgi:hypothetical protein